MVKFNKPMINSRVIKNSFTQLKERLFNIRCFNWFLVYYFLDPTLHYEFGAHITGRQCYIEFTVFQWYCSSVCCYCLELSMANYIFV